MTCELCRETLKPVPDPELAAEMLCEECSTAELDEARELALEAARAVIPVHNVPERLLTGAGSRRSRPRQSDAARRLH